MTVKILWTEQGQILGDIIDDVYGDHYVIENPVFLSPGPQGVNMLPVLMFTEEKTLKVPYSQARFGGPLEPLKELRNHYNSQFGAGIQLLT